MFLSFIWKVPRKLWTIYKLWRLKKKLEKIVKQIKEGKMPIFEWKKLVAAVIGAMVTFFGEALGLDADQIQTLIQLIMAFLIGQGLADFGKGKRVAEMKVAMSAKKAKLFEGMESGGA